MSAAAAGYRATMIEVKDVQRQAKRLEALLAERFGAREGDLSQRLARVGRGLPGSVRRDAGLVAEAARMAGNPKLAHRADPRAVAAAFARAEAQLKRVDVADRRKGRILSVLGTLAFNLLLAAGGLLALLIARGFL
ncbi:hypothetical protein [Puniceibacterium sp. IMCC21224]|uniref:hypothetical protein n=1 Tax=Puniceibacterium sp. IMCC21224 TaxID=1618204 RepID=UPI001E615269|nr:hypothetical protein [Puniceibacterium sp. IMCC21224]